MPISPEEKGFGQGSPELARWAEKVFQPEDAVLAEIRARSIREGLPAIAVGRFDGLHLEVLARLVGARKEIGRASCREIGAVRAAVVPFTTNSDTQTRRATSTNVSPATRPRPRRRA